METPQAVEERKKELQQQKTKFLEEVISAASRYERLIVNKDFLDVLEDLKKLVDLHKAEINGYLTAYSLSSSFFKKMRLAEVMSQHQLRMQQIQDAINYPQTLVQKAIEAREELVKLKTIERENSNV